MCAARPGHLHCVAADGAGRADHDYALPGGNAEQLERAERSRRRDRQRGSLLVGDSVRDACDRFGLCARHDRGVLGVRAVGPRRAEDAAAMALIAKERTSELMKDAYGLAVTALVSGVAPIGRTMFADAGQLEDVLSTKPLRMAGA